MYLLLGHWGDPCCAGVFARLDARGLSARIVESPLQPPAELIWRLDDDGLQSRLYSDRSDDDIAGVLVRDTGWLDAAGWDRDDHAYMQAELRAATLAWLAGLRCPVINRPDAAMFYRAAGAPLIWWRSLLRTSGLPLPDVVITNDTTAAGAFREQLSQSGVSGAVYSPFAGTSSYLLADDDAWTRLSAMQTRTLVSLSEPHRAVSLACVVGGGVIWNDAPEPAAVELDAAIRRFAVAAGLTFVEIGIAPVRRGAAVVMVEPRPRLEHFDAPARERILDALVAELTAAPAAAIASVTVRS